MYGKTNAGTGGSNNGAPVLLWKNASPTSAFAEQPVTFDTSKYPLIFVALRFRADLTSGTTVLLTKGQKYSVRQPSAITVGAEAVYYSARTLTYNNTGVDFGAGYEQAATTSTKDNEYCVPTEIYGIKGVAE
jgi:hypothetical protein